MGLVQEQCRSGKISIVHKFNPITRLYEVRSWKKKDENEKRKQKGEEKYKGKERKGKEI